MLKALRNESPIKPTEYKVEKPNSFTEEPGALTEAENIWTRVQEGKKTVRKHLVMKEHHNSCFSLQEPPLRILLLLLLLLCPLHPPLSHRLPSCPPSVQSSSGPPASKFPPQHRSTNLFAGWTSGHVHPVPACPEHLTWVMSIRNPHSPVRSGCVKASSLVLCRLRCLVFMWRRCSNQQQPAATSSNGQMLKSVLVLLVFLLVFYVLLEVLCTPSRHLKQADIFRSSQIYI